MGLHPMADGEFPPVPLTPPPGIVKTESDRVVEGRWTDTQWMRFTGGLPQKIGGWAKQTTSAASGVIRAMHAWRDLSSNEFMAAGTYRKLYVYERDFTQHDITPLADSGTLGNDPFAVVDTSNIVTVMDAAHGRNPGDLAIFDGATGGGGITIDGEYTILTVPSAGSYTIQHSAAATSTDATTGGAAVTYEYEIGIGVERGIYGLGYGAGGYGIGTYGTERTSSTIFIEPRIWAFDHFGRILLAAYNGGTLYAWDPDGGFVRAVKVADAPDDIRHMFITEERFVFALCEGMRVDWCTQNDYTTWTPATDNTANTRTLSVGTKLIAGCSLGKTLSLVWSDFALYVFQYTGTNAIFSSRVAGRNCGLVSPSCFATANGIAFWMGHSNFYYYNGAVQPIPNVRDIRDYVFDALNRENAFLSWAEYLPKFNEIVWYYIATGDTEPSYYVLLCLDDFSWAAGQLTRTAGASFTHGDTRPYMASDDGHIYLHEEGVDADGVALEASITLGPSALQGGAQLFNIDGFMADFHDQAGDITATFSGWDRLRHATIDTQEITIGEDDDLIDLRLEGRYVSLELVTNEIGGYFRWGKPDVMVSSNGTRR